MIQNKIKQNKYVNGVIIVSLLFQHKLNYFSFCQTFEKLFIICAKIVIK
jgi:hypothetical protein